MSTPRARYRYLAYCVVRDAIGFYLGIPKFFKDCNLDCITQEKLEARKQLAQRRGVLLTDKKIAKYTKSIQEALRQRQEQLQEDYEYCKEVLFDKDNLWLQLLNLDPDFIKTYIEKLPEDARNQLAIVPSWTTKDQSLGRPYLNDDLDKRSLAL